MDLLWFALAHPRPFLDARCRILCCVLLESVHCHLECVHTAIGWDGMCLVQSTCGWAVLFVGLSSSSLSLSRALLAGTREATWVGGAHGVDAGDDVAS